jgi:hypothetical protein
LKSQSFLSILINNESHLFRQPATFFQQIRARERREATGQGLFALSRNTRNRPDYNGANKKWVFFSFATITSKSRDVTA